MKTNRPAKSRASKTNTKGGKKASNKQTQPLEKVSVGTEKPLASDTAPDIIEALTDKAAEENEISAPTATENTADMSAPDTKRMIMEKTLTFTKLSKSGAYAIYQGLRAKIRVPVTVFPESKPVENFQAVGEFAGPRERKPQMTAEERKAYRASRPKLTLAQKIEKQKARLAKMEEQAKLETSPEARETVGSF